MYESWIIEFIGPILATRRLGWWNFQANCYRPEMVSKKLNSYKYVIRISTYMHAYHFKKKIVLQNDKSCKLNKNLFVSTKSAWRKLYFNFIKVWGKAYHLFIYTKSCAVYNFKIEFGKMTNLLVMAHKNIILSKVFSTLLFVTVYTRWLLYGFSWSLLIQFLFYFILFYFINQKQVYYK